MFNLKIVINHKLTAFVNFLKLFFKLWLIHVPSSVFKECCIKVFTSSL